MSCLFVVLLRSTTASSTTWLILIPLPYFHALASIITLTTHASSGLRLVYGVLLISDPNSAFIVAEIVDPTVNIIIDHLTSLQEGLFNIEGSFCGSL